MVNNVRQTTKKHHPLIVKLEMVHYGPTLASFPSHCLFSSNIRSLWKPAKGWWNHGGIPLVIGGRFFHKVVGTQIGSHRIFLKIANQGWAVRYLHLLNMYHSICQKEIGLFVTVILLISGLYRMYPLVSDVLLKHPLFDRCRCNCPFELGMIWWTFASLMAAGFPYWLPHSPFFRPWKRGSLNSHQITRDTWYKVVLCVCLCLLT